MSARLLMLPRPPEEEVDFRHVITDEEAKQLAERNRRRIEEAKRRLGSKYLLAHPIKKKAEA